MKVLTLFPTRGLTLEKNLMTVVTVGKVSITKQTLTNMSESTQERNLTHVLSVEKIFGRILIEVATKEFMSERRYLSVQNVGKPSQGMKHLCFICRVIKLRGHTVAGNVGEDLVGCQTVPVMKKYIQYVRTGSRSRIRKGLVVLPQLKMFLTDFWIF